MPERARFLLGPGLADCNRGDQALMWEAIRSVRQAYPDCEISVMADVHDDPEDCQSRQTRKLGIGILPMLLPNPRRAVTKDKGEFIDSKSTLAKMMTRAGLDFLRTSCLLLFPKSRAVAQWALGPEGYVTYDFLRGCKGMVAKGGGFFYAHRGARWAYYIWFGLFSLLLSQRCGIKVLVLPNSFGPFETRWSRWLARHVLRRCSLLTSREPPSQEELRRLGCDKGILFPDMAFALDPADEDWAKTELTRLGVPFDQKCVGVTMRPFRFPTAKNPKELFERYVQSIAALLEHLVAKGYVPILFAHVTGPHAHEDDRIALRNLLEVSSVRDRTVFVDGDYNCREIKAMYRHMTCMVCTRFHSAIFSISQNIPCVAVSYQGHKAGGIMSEMGLGDYCLEIGTIDSESVISVFERLVQNESKIKAKMAAYMATCQERLDKLDKLVIATIGSAETSVPSGGNN